MRAIPRIICHDFVLCLKTAVCYLTTYPVIVILCVVLVRITCLWDEEAGRTLSVLTSGGYRRAKIDSDPIRIQRNAILYTSRYLSDSIGSLKNPMPMPIDDMRGGNTEIQVFILARSTPCFQPSAHSSVFVMAYRIPQRDD